MHHQICRFLLLLCIAGVSQAREPRLIPTPGETPSDASADAVIEIVSKALSESLQAAPPAAAPAPPAAPSAADEPPLEPADIDFARDIQPILKRRCYACHDTVETVAGNGRFDSFEGLNSSGYITAGDANKSEFYRVLVPDYKHEARMPKGESSLSYTERQLIRHWIQDGAVMPEGNHRLLGKNAIREVFFIEDDSQLVTIRNDGMFDLWSVATGQRLRRWRVPQMFDSTEIVNADLRALKEPLNEDPLSRYVLGIAGSFSGQSQQLSVFPFFLLSGESYNHEVIHGETFNKGTESCQLQISADGKWYLMSSENFIDCIRPADKVDSHQVLNLAPGLLKRPVYLTSLSPDDQYILGSSIDGRYELNVWPLRLQKDKQPQIGEILAAARLGQQPVDIAWRPNGQSVAVAFADGSIALFDVVREDADSPIFALEHGTSLDPKWDDSMMPDLAHQCRMRFSQDGNRLLCMGKECVVFDVEDQSILSRFAAGMAPLCSRLSFNGDVAVTTGFDGSISLWNTDSGELIRNISTKATAASDLAWSKDGNKLSWKTGGTPVGIDLRNLAAATVDSKEAYLPSNRENLSIQGTQLKHSWLGATVSTQSLNEIKESVSIDEIFDNKLLAAVSKRDNRINLYPVTHNNSQIYPKRKFNAHVQEVTDIAFSPNGKLLASSGTDGSVHLWNCRTLFLYGQVDCVPLLSMIESESIELYTPKWIGRRANPAPDSLIQFRRLLPSDLNFQSQLHRISSVLTETVDHEAYTQEVVAKDIGNFPADDAKYQRYFSFAYLMLNGYCQLDNNECKNSLAFCLNSLSWSKSMVRPIPVDVAGAVFRVDLRSLNSDAATAAGWTVWTKDKWDELARSSPYRQPALAEQDSIRTQTGCDRPWIRGDWFIKQALDPDRYIELLAIPGTEDELVQRLRVADDPIRVGFHDSGIMKHNRLLERRSVQGDGLLYPKDERRFFWKSFDFAGPLERRNLFLHPTGPANDRDGSANDFQHDAAEVLFSLPNGMIAFAMFDPAGGRWNRPAADVTIPQIEHYPVSCFSCHSSGVRKANDQLRTFVQTNPANFSVKVTKKVLEYHKPHVVLDQTFTDDIQVFSNAEKEGGLSVGVSYLPTHTLTISFDEAIAEAAASPAYLKQQLERYTGPLQVSESKIDRLSFLQAYQANFLEGNAPADRRESTAEANHDAPIKSKHESSALFKLSFIQRISFAACMLVFALLLVCLSAKGSHMASLTACSGLICGVIGLAIALVTLVAPAEAMRKPNSLGHATLPKPSDSEVKEQASQATDNKLESQESPNLAFLRDLTGSSVEHTNFAPLLKVEAKSAADHLVHAWIYNERHEPHLALAAASKALELDSNLTAAIAERGYALLLKQDTERAHHAIEEYREKSDVKSKAQMVLPLHSKVNWFIQTTRDLNLNDNTQAEEFLKTVPELSKLLIIAELMPHERQLSRCVLTVAMTDWSEDLDFRSTSYVPRLAERLAQAQPEPLISEEMLADALCKSGLHMRKNTDRTRPAYANVVRVLDEYIQIETRNIPLSLTPSARFAQLTNVLDILLKDAKNLGDESAIGKAAERYKGLGKLVVACRTQDETVRKQIVESLKRSRRRLQLLGKTEYANECLKLAREFDQ